ncbi:uncharacterized protein GGS25DRAFT_531898, partial [Hypoxylon fragiforme]|uniref:uncharacterized protein n=1 Tax=Hypoxylon fragiforme TaxID=63214 RepID=UPI0020C63610
YFIRQKVVFRVTTRLDPSLPSKAATISAVESAPTVVETVFPSSATPAISPASAAVTTGTVIPGIVAWFLSLIGSAFALIVPAIVSITAIVAIGPRGAIIVAIICNGNMRLE